MLKRKFKLNKNIILYNANCSDILKNFKNKKIDLILTDPPYGINLEYDIYKDTEENWFKLINKILPEMIRVSKMVIMPCCRIKRLNWIYKNFPPDWMVCWYKGSPGHRSFIGFNDWESHLIYGKTRKNLSMHDYFQTNLKNDKNINHPCPKPLDWANWLISKSTNKNDLILDPFAGSGTTLLSSYLLDRRYIGIELSKKYCNEIKRRFKNIKIKKNKNIKDFLK